MGNVGPKGNVWTLLESVAVGADTVPVVMDFNTATYSLHKGLGDLLELSSDDGQPFAGADCWAAEEQRFSKGTC